MKQKTSCEVLHPSSHESDLTPSISHVLPRRPQQTDKSNWIGNNDVIKISSGARVELHAHKQTNIKTKKQQRQR